MKILILFLLTFPFISFAQQKKQSKEEYILATVLYDMTYHFDTTDYGHVDQDVMALDLGKEHSLYYSKDAKDLDSSIAIETKKMKQLGRSFVDFSLIARRINKSPDIFITDLKNNIVYDQRMYEGQVYWLKTKSSKIHWEILDSTKKINNYVCQKAIGISSGRQYTVWFTTDLPYSFGPRRLFGLPGLILEAYDQTNHVSYRFKQFMKRDQSQLLVIPKSTAIISDYTTFKRMEDASERQYANGFSKTETKTITDEKGNAKTVTTTTSGGVSPSTGKSNRYNFQLDSILE